MGILKCTHTISVTGLLATAWSFPPPPSLRMRYSGTLERFPPDVNRFVPKGIP